MKRTPAESCSCRYYEAYNAGNIDAIAPLLAPDVSYHDMIYEESFEGRDTVLAYLRKVRTIMPAGELEFVIEDITDGDDDKVGITWHVECGDGIVFPFSRGCSFYNLKNGARPIPGHHCLLAQKFLWSVVTRCPLIACQVGDHLAFIA